MRPRAYVCHQPPATGEFRYEMDSGQVIWPSVSTSITRRKARGSTLPGPLPRTRTISTPHVRCAWRGAIRLPHSDRPSHSPQQGCLEPLEVIIPPGSMLDPSPPAAVAPETSKPPMHRRCVVRSTGHTRCLPRHDEQSDVRRQPLQYYETIAGVRAPARLRRLRRRTDPHDQLATHPIRKSSSRSFPCSCASFLCAVDLGRGLYVRRRNRTRLEFRPLCQGFLWPITACCAVWLEGGKRRGVGTASIRRTSGEIERLGATARFDSHPVTS